MTGFTYLSQVYDEMLAIYEDIEKQIASKYETM